ncbi:lish motif-containing protein [Microthyrium microscopicum]|uniref:Lish motif-containing protein n=1 Tax=Microthyrium microscopicum TaxID=703497 RepID=A0A6A6UMI2_9PEZI|nr:lish motif-containing protein [Microthyrium microscopicum]
MSTSSASVATPTRSHFSRRVEEVRPSKGDINAVIMDYLLSEGYPDAAQKFASEANLLPELSIETIEHRVEIRNCILAGDIETAIERINDLNPQILDKNSKLHFALLRLQLVEIVKRGDPNNKEDLMKAISFANKQLAPRAKESKEFIEDLEKGMALIIFPRDNLPVTLKPLLDPALRFDIAAQVNEAILLSSGSRREARIKDLIKLRQWSEQKARDMKKAIPARLSLGLNLDDETDDDNMNGDGDAMVT